jgi:hypothetical protein
VTKGCDVYEKRLAIDGVPSMRRVVVVKKVASTKSRADGESMMSISGYHLRPAFTFPKVEQLFSPNTPKSIDRCLI